MRPSVVLNAGTISVRFGNAALVAPAMAVTAFIVSVVACVEKLHDITMSAGFVPVACAMPRCALVSWQTAFCVAFVNVLQSAGAALMSL